MKIIHENYVCVNNKENKIHKKVYIDIDDIYNLVYNKHCKEDLKSSKEKEDIPIKYVEELYKVSQSTAATTLRSYNGLDFGAPKLTIGTHGVILEWEAVPGSTEYIIYRKTEDQGASFKEIARVAKPGTLDSSAKKGMTYEYYIEAHKGDEILRSGIAKITRPAPAATPTPIAGKFAAPELTVKNGVGIYIRWNAVSNAAGYTVYRRIANSQEEFKLLALSPSYSYLPPCKIANEAGFFYIMHAYR